MMPIGAAGVMIDGEYTVKAALRLIAGEQATRIAQGPAMRTFSPRQAKQAKQEKPAPTTCKKSGATTGTGDPDLASVLAGET